MIKQLKATAPLNCYIDEIWLVDGEVMTEADIIMPTGQVHMVFNFGAPYQLLINDQLVTVPNYGVFGQFKEPLAVHYNGPIRQIGIAFKPFAFLMFFGVAYTLRLNAIVDCKDFIEHPLMAAVITYVQDLNQKDRLREIEGLEALFLPYIKKSEKTDLLEALINHIEDSKGQCTIKELADTFNYSISSLERLFKKYFDLTPKAYSDMIRFKESLLSEKPEAYYYDQSHFIRACKRYTNKSSNHLYNCSELTLSYMIKNIK